jgi:hypothetical protein
VLSSDRIQSLIETDNSLATFKADTTVSSSPGSAYLKELGAKGIPLIVVDGPGVDTALQAEFYTVESLIEMIDQARGVKTDRLSQRRRP